MRSSLGEKRYAVTAAAILVMVFAWLPLGAQNAAAPPRVTLVAGSDAQFRDLVSKYYPNVGSSPYFDRIRRTSVIVVNHAHLPIRALVVRWTLTAADGTSTVSYSCLCPEATVPSALPNSQVAIPFAGYSLLSPVAHEEATEESAARKSDPRVTSPLTDLPARYNSLLQNQTIQAQIDSIVFSDHTIAGKDHYGIAAKLACETSGTITEAREIAALQKVGGDVEAQLRQDMLLNSRFTDPEKDIASCMQARGRAAYRLLSLYARANEEQFTNTVTSLSTATPFTLRPRVRGE
jgi:hypothetical protein